MEGVVGDKHEAGDDQEYDTVYGEVLLQALSQYGKEEETQLQTHNGHYHEVDGRGVNLFADN